MKTYEIHEIYRYTEDGGEYIVGDIHTIESNGRLGVYDFLYRIHDPANGKDNVLSIYGIWWYDSILLKYERKIAREIKKILKSHPKFKRTEE